MHLATAALAYFVDGVPYAGRLVPAPGSSAHLFTHGEPRPFAAGPCTVAVLHSDGIESVPLPRPVPEGIRCFDRWANPLPQAPVEAARSLVYLVAEGNEGAAILRAALEEVPSPKSVSTTPEMLFDTVLQALVTGSPPLWSLCSVQGSAAYAVGPDGPVAATRTMLQRSGKERGTFALPENTVVKSTSFRNAQAFIIAVASLEANGRPWTLSYTAVKDSPDTSWMLVSLTLLPATLETSLSPDSENLAPIRVWDASLREAKTDPLYATLYDGPCSMAATTRNGEYVVFTRGDYLVSMLKTVAMWGSIGGTPLMLDTVALGPDLALALGNWNLSSLALGVGPYTVAATLLHVPGGWKLAALCIGPNEPS